MLLNAITVRRSGEHTVAVKRINYAVAGWPQENGERREAASCRVKKALVRCIEGSFS